MVCLSVITWWVPSEFMPGCIVLAVGRGPRPLRYQRRHHLQDKFGAQIFGRFDAPLAELTDSGCGELRLELSFRTSTPTTLDPFSGEAVRWLMPLHLVNISDAPDSGRLLEPYKPFGDLFFTEANQLRYLSFFGRTGFETEPPSPVRRSPRVLRGGAEHPDSSRQRWVSEFFEAVMGIRDLEAELKTLNTLFVESSSGGAQVQFQSSRLLLRCKGAALYVMAPLHDSRRSGGWADRYIKCCSSSGG